MRTALLRLLLPLPIVLFAGWQNPAQAQRSTNQFGGIGVGVGIGYGPGYGPYGGRYGSGFGPGFGYGAGWGPWGPGWGWSPGGFMADFQGFYGNGMSKYGPPVPTYRPVPGAFGGGDSRFFEPPPLFGPLPFGGWGGYARIPLEANYDHLLGKRHEPLMAPGVLGAPNPIPTDLLPAPSEPALEILAKSAPLTIRIEVPTPDAKLFVDGVEVKSTGKTRQFTTPKLDTNEPYTYSIRVEWIVGGLTTTHSKQVTGRAGDNLQVRFEE